MTDLHIRATTPDDRSCVERLVERDAEALILAEQDGELDEAGRDPRRRQ
ncbi:hypothetical protein [Streptomyces sp. SD15]